MTLSHKNIDSKRMNSRLQRIGTSSESLIIKEINLNKNFSKNNNLNMGETKENNIIVHFGDDELNDDEKIGLSVSSMDRILPRDTFIDYSLSNDHIHDNNKRISRQNKSISIDIQNIHNIPPHLPTTNTTTTSTTTTTPIDTITPSSTNTNNYSNAQPAAQFPKTNSKHISLSSSSNYTYNNNNYSNSPINNLSPTTNNNYYVNNSASTATTYNLSNNGFNSNSSYNFSNFSGTTNTNNMTNTTNNSISLSYSNNSVLSLNQRSLLHDDDEDDIDEVDGDEAEEDEDVDEEEEVNQSDAHSRVKANKSSKENPLLLMNKPPFSNGGEGINTFDRINTAKELEKDRIYWKDQKKQKSFYRKFIHSNSTKSSNSYRLKENYLDINHEDTQKLQDIFQRSISSNLNLKFKDYYTEESYSRYIHKTHTSNWKKYTMIFVLSILIIQFIQIIFGATFNFKNLLYLILLDVFGFILPIGIIYYMVGHLSASHLAKYMSIISIVTLFFLGPFAILTVNFIVAEIYIYEISLIVYIAIFLIGHYVLLTNFLYSIISIVIYFVSWCVAIAFQFNKKPSEQDSKDKQVTLTILKIFIFSCISFVMIYAIYRKELSSRRQFISDQRLFRINSKLVSQLNRIEKGLVNEAADLDAPIEKAIITVRSLMASPTIGPEHLKALDLVLSYLQLPNLFTPDLDQQVTQGLKMDDERKKWLFSEVAHKKQIERSKRSSSSESSSGAGSSLSPFYTPTPSPHDNQFEVQVINMDNYLTNYSSELLKQINDYNFPMFEFFKSTSRPLLTMSYHIFVKSGLLTRLHLSINKFLNFMSAIEDGYHPEHQFHNAEHASDVLHCIYYFSTIPNISPIFKDLDFLAMYIAACIHDFDHPGVSNKFIISIGDPLAMLYNDHSVLENHHCASALKVLNKPGNNFIERLDTEKKRELREAIIEMVLATDLSKHFSYLTSFKKKLLDTLTCNSRDDRMLLMQMLIKCCDVSNPTKCREIYKGWLNRVMSEFFSQGDREKQLNVPVSPFCNRDNSNAFSCQKGFIDFVAAPIFEAVGEYINKYEIENPTTNTTSSSKHHQHKDCSATNTSNSLNTTTDNSRRNSSSNENEKLRIHPTTSTQDEIKSQSSKTSINNSIISTSNTNALIKHSKSKKTCSLISISECQRRVNVILDGLKMNKEWIDSNAAKTEV